MTQISGFQGSLQARLWLKPEPIQNQRCRAVWAFISSRRRNVGGHWSKLRLEGDCGRILPHQLVLIEHNKLFLIPEEPLSPPPDALARAPLVTLRLLRREFVGLLRERMRAPDGSYVDGVIIPGSTSLDRGEWTAGDLETNNPLSLDSHVCFCNSDFGSERLELSLLEPLDQLVCIDGITEDDRTGRRTDVSHVRTRLLSIHILT